MDQQKRTLKPPIKISILEKQESEVSYCWRACQLFSYVLVVISGIATSLAVGSLIRMFQNECILYSNITVQSVINRTIFTKPSVSFSTSMSYCNFCQFCPVASVIFAGIWGTMFIMCGRGGNASQNLPQPWRIVPPAFLFNLVFVVLSCVSVAITFGGFSTFCDSLVHNPALNVSSCDDLTDFRWSEYPNATNFYDDIVIAETGSAITLVGWLLGFAILVIRCITHPDFLVIAKLVESSSRSGSGSPVTTTTSAAVTTTTPSTPPDKPQNEQEPLILLKPGSNTGPSQSKKSIKKTSYP